MIPALKSAFAPYGFLGGKPPTATSISRYITPVQFQRLSADVKSWRDALREMELGFWPMRVKAQRIYMDTAENPFIKAIINRWKELTMQRDYQVYQIKGSKKVVSEVLSQQLKEQAWFSQYIEAILEAELYGYSLIELGDLVEDSFPYLTVTRRENIRPDGSRENPGVPILTSLIYSLDGLHIDSSNELVDMFNHWIPSRSNRGVSTCGYGLLYNVALLEIHLRHIMEWNMDYVQDYGQPIKKGTTSKTGDERDRFEAFLKSSASSAWALLDKGTDDDITYEMVASAGTAWKVYENTESRQEAIVNQLFLGHTDAMKSTPGKLGGMVTQSKDGFGISLVEQALNAKQIHFGNIVKGHVDSTGAPRFRKIGEMCGSRLLKNLFPSSKYMFDLHNDMEERETRMRTNADRRVTAEWTSGLYKSGYSVDQSSLENWLGVKLNPVVPTTEIIKKTEKPEDANTEEDLKTNH